ncbi:MAG TPA: hypothetical protein VGM25_05100 [Caulobacteraceae bacterium]|jgi:hypothetical protein
MAVLSPQRRQASEFPVWPFDCLSLYTQVMRDFSGCAEAVSRSNDAMDAVRAETDFGAKLYADLMKGWYDLALAPWTAMAGVMAAQMRDAGAPAPEAKVPAAPLIRTSRATH